jgi:Secretion system C-terminal sorting domain
MKFITPLLLLVLGIGVSNISFAARFWIAPTASNWNNTANWSATSGGPGGVTVPGAADAVTFDGNGLGNCTIDAAVSVTSISVSGYTGTISQGANTIATSSTSTFSTGTFIGGSANITIVGVFTLSGTAFTSTTASLEFQNNAAFISGSFTHNNGKVQFNTSIAAETITGTSPAFYTLEFVGNGHSYTISSTPDITVAYNLIISGTGFINLLLGNIDVNGDINVTNSATGCGGTTMINIIGTGTQNFNGNATAGTGALPQLTINKASGNLNLANFPGVSNNFIYSAGTIIPGTSTFCFTHGSVGAYSITGSLSLSNIEFTVNTSLLTVAIALTTTLTATGNLTLDGSGSLIINTGNINVNGNITLTNTGTAGGGSATINIIGTGAETMDGSAIIFNESRLPVININDVGGTLSLAGNISFSANVTYTAGTISPGTSTCYIVNNLTITGTFSLYNLTVEPTGNTTVTIASGSTVTATNTFDLEGVASYITINIGTIAVQGNLVDNNTGTTGGGTGLILINGSGSQVFTSTVAAGHGLLPYITIQKTAGTLILSGIISETRSWTYSSGTVDASTNLSTVIFGGNNQTIMSAGMNFYNVIFTSNTSTLANSLSVNGNLTINGTGILAPGANNINLAGNWADRSTAGFTEATSTVNFIGTALQTITSPGGENFTNLTVDNTGTGIQLENNTTIATNQTMTLGNIDLNGGNTLTLGLSVANSGTLAYTTGTILNTGSFTRWFKAVTLPDLSGAGFFPMGTAANNRSLYVSAPSTSPTVGGTVTVAYNDATSSTAVSFADGASTVAVIDNLNWTVTTGNGLAGGAYDMDVQGSGFGTIGNITDLRLTLASGVVGLAGTNAGTTGDPQINRTGLSLANLSNTFFAGSVNSVSSPLPITLISFTANVVNRQVKLDWETSDEIDNDYFTVQRSKDGATWNNIQRVTGSGTNSGNSFYFVYDSTPYPGVSYYRLQQTDFDDKQTYSPICAVNIQNALSNVNIFPNPATNAVTITFPAAGNYEVMLYDCIGRLMDPPILITGSNLAISVSNMAAGVYFITIHGENSSETQKIVIRK